MPTFPIPALADVLFGNIPKDKGQGIEIFTDESLRTIGGIKTESVDPKVNGIRLKVAPQDIQFSQRSRISEQVIKDGRAFFFWRKDRFSDHLDLLEIRLSGVTRSLAKERTRPRSIREVLGQEVADIGSLFIPTSTPTTPGGEDQITLKQRDWLRLWRITREPFVTENGINNHYIRLITPALPTPITFIGHFTAPIDWRHSA
ncbi:MAG: hypothetical protein MN733_06170, partial [Nitrososphaera sp.]|nr:hypothetical protein [Nitrososphaera sp.]